MKDKIKKLIEFYTKEVDALDTKIHIKNMESSMSSKLDIQYYLGIKHRTSDVIRELKIILNSESSSKTGTLPNNEGKEKVCVHNWASSVAYKGARVCSKCGVYK